MVATAFDKYEGLGNDFVVIETTDPSFVGATVATQICDRRFGVGADGVLLLLPPQTAKGAVRMKVWNADGSVPEMCGNGIRCVVMHLARTRAKKAGPLTIETDAGPRVCTLEPGDDSVSVDMGVVQYARDERLEIDGTTVSVSLADAGNPHAVLFGEYARTDVERLGPRIAEHPTFPRGTNVEFAAVHERNIDLVVWERGVGVTLACGTGACATAVVARAKGLVPEDGPVIVRLPGGSLEISFVEHGGVRMRGPARHVYSGLLEPRLLEAPR